MERCRRHYCGGCPAVVPHGLRVRANWRHWSEMGPGASPLLIPGSLGHPFVMDFVDGHFGKRDYNAGHDGTE